MTSLCFPIFFIYTPYPIHGIHEMWMSFILQKGLMKMLLLKLIGGFFGLLMVIAAALMIIGIIIQVFHDE